MHKIFAPRWNAKLALCALLSAVPLLVLIGMVCRFHINAPFGEQWFIANYLEVISRGEFKLWYLFLQDAGERPAFPVSIMLGLALLSKYNVAVELGVVILLAVGSYAILVSKSISTLRSLGSSKACWIAPLLSVLVFSLSQWENWLWGARINALLNIVCVVAGTAMLCGREIKPAILGGAIAMGFVAMFSFSNAFVYWVYGIILLGLDPNRRRSAINLSIWVVAVALCSVAFFSDYKMPYTAIPIGNAFKTPGNSLEFIIRYLGAPMLYWDQYHAALPWILTAGTAGLCLYLGTTLLLLLTFRVQLRAIAFWLAIGAYAIGSGTMCAIGRGFGGSPLTPRYISTSSLFWIANIGLLSALIVRAKQCENASVAMRKSLRAASFAVLMLIAACSATASYCGKNGFFRYYDNLLPAERELFVMKDDRLLKKLFNHPDEIRRLVPFLKSHHLSVFH